MTLFEGLKLGALQGLTEFLPVSSSGHLALFNTGGMTLFTEIILHAGTLLAVLLVFRKEAAAVFLSPLRIPRLVREGGAGALRRDPQLRLLLLLAMASVPAAVAGLATHDLMERLLASPGVKTWVGIALCGTGAVLLATAFIRRSHVDDLESISLLQALAIGLFQAAAILPGLSRSGLTIAAALLVGLSRPAAGTFSFLLAVPIITAATGYQVLQAVRTGGVAFLPAYHLGGAAAAFAVGLAALVLLLKVVKGGKLHHFAWYCFALGGLALTVL